MSCLRRAAQWVTKALFYAKSANKRVDMLDCRPITHIIISDCNALCERFGKAL